MTKSYEISFADGFSLQITAGDDKAIPVVELLARAMMLKTGEAEHTLQVFTGETEELFSLQGKKIICRILPPVNQDDIAFKVVQVSLAVAHLLQKRGGILVHGGLAEYQGQGVILAAPSGTGKTTTSDRLPAPWRSLSDDLVLIARSADGNYYGHPWPTWSRFYFGGPGGSWKTEYSVPLQSLYFLYQSPEDGLEELNANQAAAMLIESVEQANMVFNNDMLPADIHENHLEQFGIVCEVTANLPAYRLLLSLTGNFWTLLEESLQQAKSKILSLSVVNARTGAFDQIKNAATGIVVSGSSMYPTLKSPGYIDVQPYGNEKPRRGDIIHFRSPSSGTMVVHRVMKVRPQGLVTRGDNNTQNDPDLVPLLSVDGKVVAVKDAKGSRQLRGGPAGMTDFAYARLYCTFRIILGRIYRRLFPSYSLTGSLHRFTPKSVNFKIVFFGIPMRGHLKIMSGNICVGYYQKGVWHITYPWRLWVDPTKIATAAKQVDLSQEQFILRFI